MLLSGGTANVPTQWAFHVMDGFTVLGETFDGTTIVTEEMIVDGVLTAETDWRARAFGDVNNDGEMTPADSTMIQNHIMRIALLEGENLFAADVDRDGIIRMMDLALVQGFMLDAPVTLGGRR